jgi:hypothetical protein
MRPDFEAFLSRNTDLASSFSPIIICHIVQNLAHSLLSPRYTSIPWDNSLHFPTGKLKVQNKPGHKQKWICACFDPLLYVFSLIFCIDAT